MIDPLDFGEWLIVNKVNLQGKVQDIPAIYAYTHPTVPIEEIHLVMDTEAIKELMIVLFNKEDMH